ncbi:MAG: dipeptide ABC transporter ATP-binding protein [Firmicutes bacterium]|nr:dipeptide ABC transporter ATP-binding protein [Bacillota bacterium]
MDESKILLETVDLKKYFENKKFLSPKTVLKAVDGIDLVVHQHETVGLVGESGCGKSTLGRAILKLHEPTSGKIIFKGSEIQDYKFNQMREIRRQMQMIFQDPFASLNPRYNILQAVRAPLDVAQIGTPKERNDKAMEMLSYVGLNESFAEKYPHEMSGGQRQRVVIARAMIIDPDFVVCDEPVSALDVSVRAQVLNLMKKVQSEKQVSYLFISHDLSVVRYLCDSVNVMYLGKIVESGSKEDIFDHPRHPYTKALLSAIPIPDVAERPKRIVLEGDVPSPLNPPSGCHFRTRCPYATKECAEMEPELKAVEGNHKVACHYSEKLS